MSVNQVAFILSEFVLMNSMRSQGTVHPEYTRSYASIRTRYTVHPEHIRSYASMRSRYTVHPEHKKTECELTHSAFFCLKFVSYDGARIFAAFGPRSPSSSSYSTS